MTDQAFKAFSQAKYLHSAARERSMQFGSNRVLCHEARPLRKDTAHIASSHRQHTREFAEGGPGPSMVLLAILRLRREVDVDYLTAVAPRSHRWHDGRPRHRPGRITEVPDTVRAARNRKDNVLSSDGCWPGRRRCCRLDGATDFNNAAHHTISWSKMAFTSMFDAGRQNTAIWVLADQKPVGHPRQMHNRHCHAIAQPGKLQNPLERLLPTPVCVSCVDMGGDSRRVMSVFYLSGFQ
ncbi:hypothetical protein FN846DRAFT_590222 [Sphaerosporella brunnea]|uniref:Uncharacterized protein n=1 Tax=Sphaerosporella brunnea TaxID=1250544 RepID=A0A5J5ECY4_9PEZI|nr:hypothetical protein FN846DRAFT_590222 [Sphaerosporella brunnea]